MNYIAFFNKNGSEKLAITTMANSYYEFDDNTSYIINEICSRNHYAFRLVDYINKKTPIIEERLFNE